MRVYLQKQVFFQETEAKIIYAFIKGQRKYPLIFSDFTITLIFLKEA